MDDNIIRRMSFAFRIIKATDTHTQYVILIVFSWQQLLKERSPVLRYTYFACLVGVLPLFYILITRVK